MKLWRSTVGRPLVALALACTILGPGMAQAPQSLEPVPQPPAAGDPAARETGTAAGHPGATPDAMPADAAGVPPGSPSAAVPVAAGRPAARPILPPADPTTAAAYAVLERHCARCHQGGRLKRATPAAGLGNILRLDELADAPHLVQRGNPDASRLYQLMLRRLMPLDVYEEQATAAGPGPEEIGAVRAWIASLAPAPLCRDRRFVTPADHARVLAAEPAGTAGRVRYVSIAHLHNGCVAFDALKVYRQAIVKLFNSLSWKPTLVPVPPVDEAGTLFRVSLDDLGWLPEHWERIMRYGPDPLGLTPPLEAEARKPFGTAVPIASADWFADTVLRAPLYYEVLGLPGTGPEILKVLQVDHDQLMRSNGIVRAAVRPSQLSILPSLVERLAARTGGLWSSYHSIAREGASDPAGFADRPVDEAVPHHASRTMFMLPNGLPAFYVVGQRGDRLDALPPDIAHRLASRRNGLRGGLDCMGCHGGGPADRDPGSLPARLAEAVIADRRAVAEAHQRLGLEPTLGLDGVEPVQALALEYARPLSAVRAAAELGVETSDLVQLADRGERPEAVLARRLVQGLVPRAEIEARGRELSEALGRPLPAGETAAAAPPPKVEAPAGTDSDGGLDPGPGIILYSDKARYRQGDALQLVVRVAADCHLTMISVDQRGRGTVLFPSDFETNTLLTAGQELRLPGAGAPYSFRLGERGREQVVALCNEAGATTDGIRHDFERQRFTDLGNYAAFLARGAAAVNGSAGQAAPQKAQTRQRGRRRGRPEAAEAKARPEQISRTAITIVVE